MSNLQKIFNTLYIEHGYSNKSFENCLKLRFKVASNGWFQTLFLKNRKIKISDFLLLFRIKNELENFFRFQAA